ncbi:MAG: glycerate kinase [Firmicutes bacterium]|nr:glycerate kinase [Bacillota bacterium]
MRVAPALFHGDTATLRRHAAQMLEAAVAAADPAAATTRAIRRDGTVLRAEGWACDLRAVRRVLVVGAGKGAAPMAQAVEALVGPWLAGGLVVTKYGHGTTLARVEVVEAGHPLPDAAGERAARRVLALAEAAGADDLLVVVLSGGGSALLPLPAPGVALEDKVAATDLLLRSGATITEVNTVRKHLSRIKGGWLARAAAPARILTLVLSDVLGNPLDAVASGPTVPDPTTFADALAVVDRHGLRAHLPAAARAYLDAGAAGQRPETPKPGDPAFARAHAAVVGDLQMAVAAAAERARALGYHVRTCGIAVQGEARVVGARFGEMVRDVRTAGTAEAVCLLMGGETTVTVRGGGRGGRNQEFALAAAWPLAGLPGVLVAAFGTDGTDGPTDAAGAMVDGTTLERARTQGLDPARALAENDTYPFFAALGDLIVTGPTRTNVNDLWVGLVAPGTAP